MEPSLFQSLTSNSNKSITTGRKTTQEQIQESQDLEALINESPVEVTSQETTEVTEESPAPQREVNDNLNVVDQQKTDSYYKSERFNTENPNSNQQKHESMLMDRANKAVKAIQKILPNTKVVLHRSEDSYSQYIDTPSRGAFDSNTNTIHINMPKATGKTIAHEVLHAVLKQKLGAEVNIQNASKNMVASVRKAIAKSKKLTPEQIAEFDTYANQFDSDVKNEEYLTNVVGFLAENYTKLDAPEKSAVKEFVQKIADFVNEKFGTDINVADFTQSDRDVVDLLNAVAEKTTKGTEISETDVSILEQGEGGEVGVLKTEGISSTEAPSVSTDTRDFADLIQDKDISDFDGQNFVTNMYDFTTAGIVDIGNGITIDLQGGKSYVPYMMKRKGLNIGDVSNLAAFNSRENAESFIRNAQEGNSTLFSPHSGTLTKSWQFQQAIFEQLVNTALDNKILSKKDIIDTFNNAIKSQEGIKEFNQFKKNLGKNIKNFNSFKSDPLEIVRLLDIENNFSSRLKEKT